MLFSSLETWNSMNIQMRTWLQGGFNNSGLHPELWQSCKNPKWAGTGQVCAKSQLQLEVQGSDSWLICLGTQPNVVTPRPRDLASKPQFPYL